MPAKVRSVFRCQECGAGAPKWAGQCPGCGAWNVLAEEMLSERAQRGRTSRSWTASSEIRPLSQAASSESPRLVTNLIEVDRLLGGGLVPGQVVLLAGAPGIGKSTLMLQLAGALAKGRKVLYVSGEESPGQVCARARRLGVASEDILLAAETDLEKILAAMERVGPSAVVVDSVQTLSHPGLSGSPGSVGQVRECAAELLRAAKAKDAVLFLLGHVTKEGAVAGPKVLEHLVDTVLQFDAEQGQLLRVLRSEKNRFGPSGEVGFFEMGERGLAQVRDAASFFIEGQGAAPVPGRAVAVALEGSRPILAEVQALVTHTRYPLPRRTATGLDLNRCLVLLASLEKHLKLHLEDRDVFLNVAGGLKASDPALDLAVCMAVTSSAREAALPTDCVFVSEVGLLGNLNRVPFLAPRLKEAGRAAFGRAVVDARSLPDLSKGGARPGLEVLGAADLAAAMRLVFRSGE